MKKEELEAVKNEIAKTMAHVLIKDEVDDLQTRLRNMICYLEKGKFDAD